MLIETETPLSGKGKIWLKFVFGNESFERYFKVELQRARKNKFVYEVENSFPEEMVKLIFGHDAVIVE
ncbi:hypothetical protein [Thermovibrio sp.]